MSISIPKTIPDAKLHRLELTPFEIRLLINALDFAIGNTSARPSTGNHFALRALLKRSQVSQPEPVAPTDEDLMAAARKAIDTYPRGSELPYFLHEDSSEYEPMLLALRSAARWGTLAIEPVSVSESLPEPEDCDEEGRCWVFDDMLGLPSWTLIKVLGKNLEPDMTWLPHHALPVPAPANNTRGTH